MNNFNKCSDFDLIKLLQNHYETYYLNYLNDNKQEIEFRRTILTTLLERLNEYEN